MSLARDSAAGDPVAEETKSPAMVLPGDCASGGVDEGGSEKGEEQLKAGEAKASEAKASGQKVRERTDRQKAGEAKASEAEALGQKVREKVEARETLARGGKWGSTGTLVDEVPHGITVTRRRGRPKGVRDKAPRKRRKTTENSVGAGVGGGEELDFAVYDHAEEGEVFLEAWVQLSVASAVRTPEAPQWVEAISREKLKLEAQNTWRELDDSELQKQKQVLPIAILLNRKRDQSFKARAVVLGNLVAPGETEVCAPVVSTAGNRFLVTSAARAGDAMIPFDVDVAFLNAELDTDDEVYVRLPARWAKTSEQTVKRLVKALCGLRQSPRAWCEKCGESLRPLGWEPCANEPGLWRRLSVVVLDRFVKMSVYADDRLATGPCERELDAEVARVLTVFPGKIIPADDLGDGWVRWDLLGGDLLYRRSSREMRFTMERYIRKAAERFGLTGAKPCYSPVFSEKNLLLDEDKPPIKFPFRELVGSLQWAATVCRPDVAQPVSVLARCSARVLTRAKVNAGKKVLRFLLATAGEGVTYSPASEQEFRKTCGELLPEGECAPESTRSRMRASRPARSLSSLPLVA